MAADIAPELYEKIKELFEQKYAQAQLFGNSISETLKALEEGTATFRDADLYAGEVGSLLSEALKECISLEDMPGGKFYYNIAQKTVGKALQDEYRLASDIAVRIQEEMNEAAGIGLKAVRPEPNDHRIRNVVDRASRAETKEQLEAALTELVKTEVRRASDDTQKANAKLHASAGLEVKVEREYDGVGLSGDRDCSWCQDRAGTFTYTEALANGVFERHEGCGCIIEYTSRKGEKTRGRGFVETNGKTGTGWVWEDAASSEQRVSKEKQILQQKKYPISERNFHTYNNTKSDSIRPRSIEKELKKSEIGKQVLEYLQKNDVEVQLLYGIDNPDGIFGSYDITEDIIRVYCDKTKTILETSKTIIHEAKHRMNDGKGLSDFNNEFSAYAAEALHEFGILTTDIENNIIKLLKEKYGFERE